MMHRVIVVGILAVAALAPALAQRTLVFGKPRITATPAPWIPIPQSVQSIFPTVKPNSLFGSDFFPAAPTVLLDNTNDSGFYFPEPNIVLDDANISNAKDTDGDNTYYLTELEYAFYVPSEQTVNVSVYLAGADPVSGGPDANDLAQPIATFSGTLASGAYIFTVTFPNCTPAEQTTLQFTSNGNDYDYFWTGISFGASNCTGGPGMLLASGPDYEDDVFWWEGNQSCGGTYGVGFYYFGGNPRASFHLKVTGAATMEDAIVPNPDADGNGCVDDADLLAVLLAFGNTGDPGITGDTNCDGIVDDADLLAVLLAFGSGC